MQNTTKPKPASRLRTWRDLVTQDLRFAARGLRLRPGFTAMVVVTLSLGIGANATMFGILDRLLLRPPAHIQDPDRLVQVHTRHFGQQGVQSSQPYRFYKDMLEGVPDFAGVAVSTPSAVLRREYYPLGRGAEASRVAGAQVTPGFFPLLGVRPDLGRFFQEDESGEQRAGKLAVLGYGYWQRHYGGRDDALGKTLELGTERYEIVGVAPQGFTGAELSDIDVWIPIAAADGLRFAKGPDWNTTRNSQWLNVYARLKPGVSVEQARAQATAAFRAGERERVAAASAADRHYYTDPDSEEVVFGSIIPGRSPAGFGIGAASGEVRVSRLLGGVALMVLLIACANVANLLLARALNRRRETAVRLALGVSRRRLIGQLVMEGHLLSVMGGAGALVCARVGSGFLRSMLLADAAWSGSPIDGRMLAFTAVAALATGMLTSLLPAWQASNPDLTSALKAGAREGAVAKSRTRTALLVTQAALAVVLLAGAGLFVRSMRNVAALSLGVDVDRVLVGSIDHASVGLSNDEAQRLYLRFAERAREIPGVSASAVSIGMSFGLGWSIKVNVPGRERPTEQHNPSQYAITPDYFTVMGIRVLSGRPFTDGDVAGAPLVAVINQTAAKTFWPGGNPVGECVKLGADTAPCTTVVGVVTDARRQQLVEKPVSQVYRPLLQLPAVYTNSTVSFFGYTLEVRTSRAPEVVAEPLRRVMQATAANVPYANVRPLQDQLGRQTRTWRLGATMFTIFGALALALAAIGLYSVVVFTIAQRRHEFGVRVALGATGGDLLRLTVVRGVLPAVGGIALGLALAVAGAPLVSGLLFQMSARDPLVLATVAMLLLAAAVLASTIPAMRVRRVDPMIALRTE